MTTPNDWLMFDPFASSAAAAAAPEPPVTVTDLVVASTALVPATTALATVAAATHPGWPPASVMGRPGDAAPAHPPGFKISNYIYHLAQDWREGIVKVTRRLFGGLQGVGLRDIPGRAELPLSREEHRGHMGIWRLEVLLER